MKGYTADSITRKTLPTDDHLPLPPPPPLEAMDGLDLKWARAQLEKLPTTTPHPKSP